jgi:hypothetical protein
MSSAPSPAVFAAAAAAPAALAAVAFLLVRDIVPALTALAKGRIRSKGHGRQMIERATDPERFQALVRRRLAAGGGGIAFCVFGGLFLFSVLIRSNG